MLVFSSPLASLLVRWQHACAFSKDSCLPFSWAMGYSGVSWALRSHLEPYRTNRLLTSAWGCSRTRHQPPGLEYWSASPETLSCRLENCSQNYFNYPGSNGTHRFGCHPVCKLLGSFALWKCCFARLCSLERYLFSPPWTSRRCIEQESQDF